MPNVLSPISSLRPHDRHRGVSRRGKSEGLSPLVRMPRSLHGHPAAEAVYGIDRLVKDVEHGRFERSMSALTAVGAAVKVE